MNKWTKEEDELLLRLKQKRLSYLDIAEIMGDKTTDALRNRFYVLTHNKRTFAEFESNARVLVYDIETSLMEFTGFRAGRVHYIGKQQLVKDYYIISWAAKWLGEDVIYSNVQTSRESKKGSDKRILKQIWQMLDEADVVVGHNVDRFDTKRLNTRFVMNGMTLPERFKSVDTLKLARKTFDFTYNDLDFICSSLGLGNKMEHEGYEMWEGCRLGDAECLTQMVDYNEQDVFLTEKLYNYLKQGMYEPPKPWRGGWKEERK